MSDKGLFKNVLYFPYIRVPESQWLSQMLLYWDNVGTIVASEYIAEPDRLGPYTLELVRLELVTQVIPAAYVYQIPDFAGAFDQYLATLGNNLDSRREQFVPEAKIDQQLTSLRLEVLKEILPSPRKPLSAEEIRRFKDRHGDKLSTFRRAVERELAVLAAIDEPALRKRRRDLFYEEVGEQIEEIKARLKEHHFGVVFGSFSAVVSAIPGVSPVYGLVSAVFNAFRASPQALHSHFAYAAYAQSELGLVPG